jgi:hypothetical protein
MAVDGTAVARTEASMSALTVLSLVVIIVVVDDADGGGAVDVFDGDDALGASLSSVLRLSLRPRLAGAVLNEHCLLNRSHVVQGSAPSHLRLYCRHTSHARVT